MCIRRVGLWSRKDGLKDLFGKEAEVIGDKESDHTMRQTSWSASLI